jgi:hypothetical protein
VHGAEQVDLDDAPLHITGDLTDRPVRHDGGVVHPDVQPTELGDSALGERVDRVGVGDVRRDGERPYTLGPAQLGDLLERSRGSCGEHHMRALLGEAGRRGAPDPAGGAGQNHDRAVQFYAPGWGGQPHGLRTTLMQPSSLFLKIS